MAWVEVVRKTILIHHSGPYKSLTRSLYFLLNIVDSLSWGRN